MGVGWILSLGTHALPRVISITSLCNGAPSTASQTLRSTARNWISRIIVITAYRARPFARYTADNETIEIRKIVHSRLIGHGAA